MSVHQRSKHQAVFWLGILLVGLHVMVGRDSARLTRANAQPALQVTPEAPEPATSPTAAASTTTVQSTRRSVQPVGPEAWRLHLPLMRIPTFYGPPLPPPTPVAAATPVDFEAVRGDLQAEGYDLAFNKIGFHTGWGGNTAGLSDWMAGLDEAGVPIFLKSVDNAAPLFEAQQLMEASGVPHMLVYRRSGSAYDVPNYNLSPEQAAVEHWDRHKDAFPPELDPAKVWIETINEVDKNRTTWLAQFALKTAELALADGFRWAAFGWSSGEPEPFHWGDPAMQQFLRLVALHPDKLAIALHEYSYTKELVSDGYPYKLGRFQHLFQVCDRYGIPRPTVFITEWGWEYQNIPEVEDAMEDIAWASWLYAAYPEVRGAAIWYLGGNFGEIANQTQKLIAPMTDYSLGNYFIITPGSGTIDTNLFSPDPATAQPVATPAGGWYP